MVAFDEILYPPLRDFPAGERDAALRSARKAPFDVIELVGIAIGVILVTAATRYQAEAWDIAGRVGLAIGNFLVAIPLLFALVGPFLVRRVRRGLCEELARRQAR